VILNLTQHPATASQRTAGVTDLTEPELTSLKEALVFDECPDASEIRDRAEFIAELACYNGLGKDEDDSPIVERAMIGGALWLMAPLAEELRIRGIEPIFAFSKREVIEELQEDGTVKKTAIFRHDGFVSAIADGEAVEPEINPTIAIQRVWNAQKETSDHTTSYSEKDKLRWAM